MGSRTRSNRKGHQVHWGKQGTEFPPFITLTTLSSWYQVSPTKLFDDLGFPPKKSRTKSQHKASLRSEKVRIKRAHYDFLGFLAQSLSKIIIKAP